MPTKQQLLDPNFWDKQQGPQTINDLTNPDAWPEPEPEKPGLVQKALHSAFDAFTGAVEPLQLPLAAVEATAADAYSLATGGKVEELAQLWHALPAYAPWGAKPDITISGEELLGKMGVENEFVKQWGGLALDFVADPLLAAGWLSATSKVAKAVGLVKEAEKLGKLAEDVRFITSPKGAVETFKKLAPGPTETLRSWSEKIWQVKLPSLRVVGEEPRVPGFRNEDAAATVGEVLFPKGVPPVGKRFEEGGTLIPETWSGSDNIGTGILDMSEGAKRKMQHIVAGTIQTLDKMYRKVDPSRGAVYRTLDDIVGGLIRDPKHFPREANWTFVGALKHKPPIRTKMLPWTEMQIKRTAGYKTFVDRLKKMHTAYNLDIPFDDLVQTAQKAAALTYATYMQAGYELSGYDQFLDLLKIVADDRAVNVDQILFHLVDSIRAGEDPEKYSSKFLQVAQSSRAIRYLKRMMKESPQFARLDPITYMQGLFHGFVTPALGRYADPKIIQDLAENWDIVAFAKALPERELAEPFSAIHEKAPKVVADLMSSLPYPALRVDDVVTALESNGIKASKDAIKEALTNISPELNAMDKAIEQIGRLQKGTTVRDVLEARLNKVRGGNNAWYKKPAYTDEDLQTLFQMTGASKQLGALGIRGAEQLKAKTLLDLAYKDLLELDLVQPWGPTPRHNIGPVTFINLPKQAKVWGRLAGTAVPLWAAREILKVLHQPGSHRQSLYQRLVNTMRKGYLSAPKTSARNIMSNLGLLHLAGIPVDEVVPKIRQARKMVLEYATTGYSKEMAGAEHMLSFLHDSSLAKWFRDPADDQMYEILEKSFKKSRTFKDWVDKFDNAVDLMANTPPVGFLGAFQAAEDYTRGAVFLWAKEKFLKQGLEEAEAVRRASHIAVNSVYDYGSVGVGVDVLRKTGLALFPAFTYFTTGRVTRALYERPGSVDLLERAITSFNKVSVPDDDERQAIDDMTAHMDYLRNHPILIPAARKNHYYVVPLDYLLPQASLSGSQLLDALAEPTFGGAVRPIVDVVTAWLSGTGEPTAMTQKFGARVFEEYETAPSKIASTAAFVGQQLVPGTARDLLDFASRRAGHYIQGAQADEVAEMMGRYLNAKPGQLLARYALGFSSYEVDTAGDTTLIGAQKAHDAWYRSQVERLQRNLKLAELNGDEAEVERLLQREEEINQEYIQRVDRTLEGLR